MINMKRYNKYIPFPTFECILLAFVVSDSIPTESKISSNYPLYLPIQFLGICLFTVKCSFKSLFTVTRTSIGVQSTFVL